MIQRLGGWLQKWGIKLLIFYVLFAIVCGGGIFGFAFYFVDFWTTGRGLDAVYARAKSAGVPLELAEVDPRPAVKPGENAADILLQLSPFQKDFDFKDDSFKMSDAELDRAVEAAQRPRLILPMPNDQLPTIERHHASGMYKLLLDLSKRGQSKIVKGLTQSGLRDFAAATALSIKLEENHGPEVTSVAGWSRGLFARCMASASANRRVSVSQIEDMRLQLTESWRPVNARNILRGQIYALVELSRRMRKFQDLEAVVQQYHVDEEAPFRLPPVQPGIPKNNAARSMLTHHLEFWIPLMPEVNDADLNVRLMRDRLKKKEETGFIVKPASRYGLSFVLLHVNSGLEDILRSETHRVLSEVAMRLHALQKLTGRWPATLSEVEVPAIDPFSEKPLFFQARADGFQIWSVGENGENDGGNDDDISLVHPYVKSTTAGQSS